MERIYHPYNLWEDFQNGFYDNISGKNKELLLKKVIELFSDSQLTEIYMQKVVDEWIYSCEHNLSNNSMNRIAYLGQSACCIYAKIPNSITMQGWSMVSEINRKEADKIANKLILKWEEKYA